MQLSKLVIWGSSWGRGFRFHRSGHAGRALGGHRRVRHAAVVDGAAGGGHDEDT